MSQQPTEEQLLACVRGENRAGIVVCPLGDGCLGDGEACFEASRLLAEHANDTLRLIDAQIQELEARKRRECLSNETGRYCYGATTELKKLRRTFLALAES